MTRTAIITIVFCTALLFSTAALAVDKLPADQAGAIGPPTGQLAFIRNGNIWVMDADGKNQDMVTEVGNAAGRLSWSPDNKQIAFTRSGTVRLEGGPDPNVGGGYRIYDVFVAWMDSVYANNRMWWTRLTEDNGSKDPEWSADGSTIVFTKDLNANTLNLLVPNYQVCTMAPDGSHFEILRKDWANFGDDFMLSPTMNADGRIVFVIMSQWKRIGLASANRSDFMIPLDSIQAQASRHQRFDFPAWSPDGQWLACIKNDINESGVFLFTPDLSEKYLVFTPPVNTGMSNMAPSFSPDSKWLTFSTNDGSIWICDITGNQSRRLSGPGLDRFPAWSK